MMYISRDTLLTESVQDLVARLTNIVGGRDVVFVKISKIGGRHSLMCLTGRHTIYVNGVVSGPENGQLFCISFAENNESDKPPVYYKFQDIVYSLTKGMLTHWSEIVSPLDTLSGSMEIWSKLGYPLALGNEVET